MAKYDSDYSRPQHEGDILLEKDDPQKRDRALAFLTRSGQEDLADMLGVRGPIPSYGGLNGQTSTVA